MATSIAYLPVSGKINKYKKAYLVALLTSFLFVLPTFVNSQTLRELFSSTSERNSEFNRDDLPNSVDMINEFSFEELICMDKELFPTKIYSKKYVNYVDCRRNLDRIQNASYLDLTYRIRWDNDRLDLYRTDVREIFICDQEEMGVYEHRGRKDPDWWMIVRNSLEFVECEGEISVGIID